VQWGVPTVKAYALKSPHLAWAAGGGGGGGASQLIFSTTLRLFVLNRGTNAYEVRPWLSALGIERGCSRVGIATLIRPIPVIPSSICSTRSRTLTRYRPLTGALGRADAGLRHPWRYAEAHGRHEPCGDRVSRLEGGGGGCPGHGLSSLLDLKRSARGGDAGAGSRGCGPCTQGPGRRC
jgi:hypothetical protein